MQTTERCLGCTQRFRNAVRRALLKLLSRFDISPNQAKRWINERDRARATAQEIQDADILSNPYRISEVDLGGAGDLPVSISAIDPGLMPDATIAARHPVPKPSSVSSPSHFRRVRAALVSMLTEALAPRSARAARQGLDLSLIHI